jgi:hypothetical protein
MTEIANKAGQLLIAAMIRNFTLAKEAVHQAGNNLDT